MISTFYNPQDNRTKILADELNFPSDIYALKGQILMKGLDPDKELILIKSDNGRYLDENKIVESMTDEIALIFLPSVLFRSGHISIEHDKEAVRIGKAMLDNGIIPDFRPPNIIRIAPIPLYNTYHEVWGVVQALKKIIDLKEYKNHSKGRKIVS